ncbi:MAG TPA: ABC transporter permease [Pyrinomonadaceae bacterium]|jgi:predicted permease|nr:ABC transporter permease [Pyrinomonadaceae bacterium]
MSTFLQDLRFGFHMLVKSPAFTAMAVLSLALGIGANAAIFTLLDAVLLKQLPVNQPQQLFFVQYGEPGFKPTSNVSFAAFEQLRSQKETIDDACFFYNSTRINLRLSESSEVVEGQLVSGNFFQTLGVNPLAGRTFSDSDDAATAANSVVISRAFWQRRFASNIAALGQSIVLNNTPFTIVGITPPEFFGAIVGNAPDVFLPSLTGERILPSRVRFRDSGLPFVVVRLKQTVNDQQAQSPISLVLQRATLEGAGTDLSSEERQKILGRRANLLPADQGFNVLRQQYSKPLKLLMGAVALVLLISCANVANLMLARATSRKREIAVRIALGASRFRISRQLLTEGLLVALLGGGSGLLLASWGSKLLLAVVSSGRNPITSGSVLSVSLPIDSRILVFTVVVSVVALIIFGLAPAWRASNPELSSTLKDTRHVGGLRRLSFGNALVIAQLAMSLTLLVGAGLFVRSLAKLRSVDTGFKRENVLLFTVDPQLIHYERPQIAALYKQMLDRIAVVPGVRSVSLSRQGLLSGGGTQGSIKVPDGIPHAEENTVTNVNGELEANMPYFGQVGPRFFETLGMSIIRGRDFNQQDNETAPKVAVINEAFARYYFGDQNPIGRIFDRGKGDGGLVEIVGLVKDAKAASIREQTPRTFYVPFLQDQSSWRETTFQVRTNLDPLTIASTIRRELQAVDPNLPIFRVRTLEDQVDESLGRERLVTTLASLFGALALVLASLGLYGVMSYSVTQSTREIGIRMALGARGVDVLRLVVKNGMTLTAVGLALGLVGAFALTRLISSLLFEVTPTDPVTFVSVSVFLCLIALLASYIPARRATKVDPLVALRYE